MSVRIRLSRVGRKKVPFFRIVAIDSRKARDGKALDILGTYNELTGQIVNFDISKLDMWVKRGAEVLNSVKKIQKKYNKASLV